MGANLIEVNLIGANLIEVLLKVKDNLAKFYYGHYKIFLIFKRYFKGDLN